MDMQWSTYIQYVYMSNCYNLIDEASSAQAARPTHTHTHKFNNLPPHTEAGIRIIKREK